MPEARYISFPTLSVYPWVGVFLSALEPDVRFYLSRNEFFLIRVGLNLDSGRQARNNKIVFPLQNLRKKNKQNKTNKKTEVYSLKEIISQTDYYLVNLLSRLQSRSYTYVSLFRCCRRRRRRRRKLSSSICV